MFDDWRNRAVGAPYGQGRWEGNTFVPAGMPGLLAVQEAAPAAAAALTPRDPGLLGDGAEGRAPWLVDGGDSDRQDTAPDGRSRTAANDFGHVGVNRNALGLAALADPTGLSSLASMGITANNVAASNAARDMLGMGSLSLGQGLGAFLGGNGYGNGMVGDLNIGGRGYGVSMGGVYSPGMIERALGGRTRTTLTPTEALARQQAAAAEARAQAMIEAARNAGYSGNGRGGGYEGGLGSASRDNAQGARGL